MTNPNRCHLLSILALVIQLRSDPAENPMKGGNIPLKDTSFFLRTT